MRAYYCDHFVLPLPEDHKFPMAKYARLRARIVEEGIIAADDLHQAVAASWDDLALVHTPQYLHDVEHGTLPRDTQRRIGFPWSPQMVERARRSVGATIQAARTAFVEGAAANLAGGTHHAFSDRGEGFCVFNDVAVAARVLLRDTAAAGRTTSGGPAVTRVAVVDCDVHQGNGTAAIFHDDHAVFTFSMHGANNFPFRKEVSRLDVTLEDGATEADYLPLLEEHLPRILDAHRPDIVFYVSGADPYEGDRLGRLKLTIEGLRRRDAYVFAECNRRGLPVVITMAGGYANDIDAIVTIHANTIREAVRITNRRVTDESIAAGPIDHPLAQSPIAQSPNRQSVA